MTETIERELTDLVEIPKSDKLSVFSAKFEDGKLHPIEPILAKVRQAIDAREQPNVSTTKGRDYIRSFAYRVKKAKTAILKVGKEVADEQKEIPKRIDATRRHVEQMLDAWHDEVRQPLTDWEDAEEKRVNAIKATLAEWQQCIDDTLERASEVIRDRLTEMQDEAVTEKRFAEYLDAARELKEKAVSALSDQLARAEKREADAAELEKLRKEAAERAAKEAEEKAAREAKEREERIAKEAEERARAKAEAEATAKVEAAERAAAEAEQRAKQAADDARREQEAKAAKEAAERAAREANEAHRKKINRAALKAFEANGIDAETAKTVITLIAQNKIPAVQITY